MSDQKMGTLAERVAAKKDWYHQIKLPDGSVTPGSHNSDEVLSHLDKLGLPKKADGLRVLDIGCRDGYFAFELERRGAAEVIGLDYEAPEYTGFEMVSEALGSKVTYWVANVYDLDPEKHGQFDLVLFLGVLYHLRNPLLAIDKIRAVTKTGGMIFSESHVIDDYFLLPDGSVTQLAAVAPILKQMPLIQYYPKATLAGDATNKMGPNMAAFRAMIEEAQYQVSAEMLFGTRGYVVGRAIQDPLLEFYRAADSGTRINRPPRGQSPV